MKNIAIIKLLTMTISLDNKNPIQNDMHRICLGWSKKR